MAVGDWAAARAGWLLVDLPERWVHTQAVARAAAAVADALQLGGERDVLVAAAYLHDVGYAAPLVRSRFHPLDGASWLRGLGRERLGRLVAHHSGARWEAEVLGLGDELAVFAEERSTVADALTYCDLTTDADGGRVTLAQRVDGIAQRYDADSPARRGLQRALPELERVVARVEARLRSAGRGLGQPM